MGEREKIKKYFLSQVYPAEITYSIHHGIRKILNRTDTALPLDYPQPPTIYYIIHWFLHEDRVDLTEEITSLLTFSHNMDFNFKYQTLIQNYYPDAES